VGLEAHAQIGVVGAARAQALLVRGGALRGCCMVYGPHSLEEERYLAARSDLVWLGSEWETRVKMSSGYRRVGTMGRCAILESQT